MQPRSAYMNDQPEPRPQLVTLLPDADRRDGDLTLRLGHDVVTPRLRKAATMWPRMKGLLGRRALDPDEGLWITPCNSIHMFFMRFAIDAVFVDRDLQVVRVCEHLKPWRMARGGKHAHSVLELPPGKAAFYNLRVGDRLTVD